MSWFNKQSVDRISARSLLVRVSPPPATLSERRAVLRALQRHGRIEVFKRLTDPSAFICAPEQGSVAQELAKAQLLTFRFIAEPFQPISTPTLPGHRDVLSRIAIYAHDASPEADADDRDGSASDPSAGRDDMVKKFQLHIQPSGDYYSHKTTVRRSLVHGPWPLSHGEERDFIHQALVDVVPDTIAQRGLCDWHTGAQLSEHAKRLRNSQQGARHWHIFERKMRERDARIRKELSDGTLLDVRSVDELAASAAASSLLQAGGGGVVGGGGDDISDEGMSITADDAAATERRAQDASADAAPPTHRHRKERIFSNAAMTADFKQGFLTTFTQDGVHGGALDDRGRTESHSLVRESADGQGAESATKAKESAPPPEG